MAKQAAQNEIAAATIRVEADGVGDAQSELEKLRAEVDRLKKAMEELKGHGSGSGGESEGGSAGGGGSGALGFVGALKRIGSVVGIGFGIKYFADLTAQIAAARIEAIRFSEELTKMQGASAGATAGVYTGIRAQLAANLGIDPAMLRGQGPNRIAGGEARAKAVQEAQEAVNRAQAGMSATDMGSAVMNLIEDFGSILPDVDALGWGQEPSRKQALRFAQQNLASTVKMQQTQALRSDPLVQQADQAVVFRLYYGNMDEVARNTSAQLMRTPR